MKANKWFILFVAILIITLGTSVQSYAQTSAPASTQAIFDKEYASHLADHKWQKLSYVAVDGSIEPLFVWTVSGSETQPRYTPVFTSAKGGGNTELVLKSGVRKVWWLTANAIVNFSDPKAISSDGDCVLRILLSTGKTATGLPSGEWCVVEVHSKDMFTSDGKRSEVAKTVTSLDLSTYPIPGLGSNTLASAQ